MSDIYYNAKENFTGVIEQLMGRYRVYAPVKEGCGHGFAPLDNAEKADLGFSNTRLSPKGLFHPQAERMFEYSLAKDDPRPESSKRRKKTSRLKSFLVSGRATQKPLISMTPTSTQKP